MPIHMLCMHRYRIFTSQLPVRIQLYSPVTPRWCQYPLSHGSVIAYHSIIHMSMLQWRAVNLVTVICIILKIFACIQCFNIIWKPIHFERKILNQLESATMFLTGNYHPKAFEAKGIPFCGVKPANSLVGQGAREWWHFEELMAVGTAPKWLVLAILQVEPTFSPSSCPASHIKKARPRRIDPPLLFSISGIVVSTMPPAPGQPRISHFLMLW